MSGASPVPSFAPSTIPVHVTVENADPKKVQQFTVKVSGNAPSPVFEIKRAVALLKGDAKIDPINSRVRLIQNVDDITLPYSVVVSARPPRTPSIKYNVAPLNERKDLVKSVVVDPLDLGIDLKFLVAPLLGNGVAPEHIKLYFIKPGFPSRVQIRDGDEIAKTGLPAGSTIQYSLEIPSTEPGHGAIHRTNVVLTAYESPAIRDLGTTWLSSAAKFANRPLFGTRTYNKDGSRGEYKWQTYKTVAKRVSDFGQGLRHLGLKKNDTVGIMSNNRTEWDITDFACSVQSFISVPLYDTLGPDAVEFIINHAAVSVVVVNFQSLKQIERVRAKCPTLKYIVLMDDQATDAKFIKEQQGKSSSFTHTFSSVQTIGASQNYPVTPAQSTDVYTICYTSGTTGNPKGAVITHGSMVSGAAGANERMPPGLMSDHEVMFSYLPLAHIYERLMHAALIPLGFAIGYSQGDNTKLVEDVAELKPSVFPGVPRVWQRIYDRINGQLADASFISKSLFESAYSSKLAQIKASTVSPTFLGDRVVFPKIAAKFGGNVKFMVSGAAPLNSRVAEFIRIVCQTHFIEGYGLTETCGVLSSMTYTEGTYGVVGTPSGTCEVKLVDVPDMEYLSSDRPYPRGEIWCRGPNVFSGYYKQPDVTAECFSHDGWFMTGDVGMWLPDGNLKIIDRKKNLFKLSQGEYIRPEYIESVYKQVPLIANIYVHGESSQSCLVAVIVPDVESLKALFPESKNKTLAEWASDKVVASTIFSAMNAAGKKEALRGFEVVKQIYLATEEPSVENGLLTPSFKLKRHEMKKKYEPQIKAMYEEEAKQPQIVAKL